MEPSAPSRTGSYENQSEGSGPGQVGNGATRGAVKQKGEVCDPFSEGTGGLGWFYQGKTGTKQLFSSHSIEMVRRLIPTRRGSRGNSPV